MLRAIAALLVVLFHVQVIFGQRAGLSAFYGAFNNGMRGVDLFFVLSGYIIGHVHFRDVGTPSRTANYFFNRASRIYPAVWIMTLLAAGLYFVGFGGSEKSGKMAPWNVIASFLLLPQVGDPLVNVTWTLKYEIFFYVIFGGMIINARVGLTLLFAWQIAVIISSALLPAESIGALGFYLRPFCLEFGIGLICAWLLDQPAFNSLARHAFLQWALLFSGTSVFIVGMMGSGLAPLPAAWCAIGAGLIVIGLILLEQAERIYVPKILVKLGGASYSIYLVNFSVTTIVAVILIRLRFTAMNDLMLMSVAAISVIAGVIFDKLVDQPIQRVLRRRVKVWLLCGAD